MTGEVFHACSDHFKALLDALESLDEETFVNVAKGVKTPREKIVTKIMECLGVGEKLKKQFDNWVAKELYRLRGNTKERGLTPRPVGTSGTLFDRWSAMRTLFSLHNPKTEISPEGGTRSNPYSQNGALHTVPESSLMLPSKTSSSGELKVPEKAESNEDGYVVEESKEKVKPDYAEEEHFGATENFYGVVETARKEEHKKHTKGVVVEQKEPEKSIPAKGRTSTFSYDSYTSCGAGTPLSKEFKTLTRDISNLDHNTTVEHQPAKAYMVPKVVMAADSEPEKSSIVNNAKSFPSVSKNTCRDDYLRPLHSNVAETFVYNSEDDSLHEQEDKEETKVSKKAENSENGSVTEESKKKVKPDYAEEEHFGASENFYGVVETARKEEHKKHTKGVVVEQKEPEKSIPAKRRTSTFSYDSYTSCGAGTPLSKEFKTLTRDISNLDHNTMVEVQPAKAYMVPKVVMAADSEPEKSSIVNNGKAFPSVSKRTCRDYHLNPPYGATDNFVNNSDDENLQEQEDKEEAKVPEKSYPSALKNTCGTNILSHLHSDVAEDFMNNSHDETHRKQEEKEVAPNKKGYTGGSQQNQKAQPHIVVEEHLGATKNFYGDAYVGKQEQVKEGDDNIEPENSNTYKDVFQQPSKVHNKNLEMELADVKATIELLRSELDIVKIQARDDIVSLTDKVEQLKKENLLESSELAQTKQELETVRAHVVSLNTIIIKQQKTIKKLEKEAEQRGAPE